MKLEAYCKQLEQRIAKLEEENAVLRKRLGIMVSAESGAVPPKACMDCAITGQAAGIHRFSPPHEKIRLFRSLFRGREDVFARRWYSVQKEKGGSHILEGKGCPICRQASSGLPRQAGGADL